MHKKVKKLTSVSFMYVCVAENAELLVFFYFLDALASLDLKLSVSEWVINVFRISSCESVSE